MTVDQLIQELDALNQPVTLTVPAKPEDLIELAHRVGRRSIVDELIRLQKQGADNGR
jgi:hypothetical protein